MKQWKKPKISKLEVKSIKTKGLTVESSLYASGAHRGELIIGGR
ncbi:TPA: hypothetical protein ACUI23_001240 [Staphylococcus pseudintermedius]|nr:MULTISPECIES: hypothetical protein [Staphylococcus]